MNEVGFMILVVENNCLIIREKWWNFRCVIRNSFKGNIGIKPMRVHSHVWSLLELVKLWLLELLMKLGHSSF
jgi:hypothetical protein